jgi:hypothetical protein
VRPTGITGNLIEIGRADELNSIPAIEGWEAGRRKPGTIWSISPVSVEWFSRVPPGVVSQMYSEKQPQILRLTTPKLKSAWGPVRSG